jgi:CxxC-x17-CxxC domain-containing protein
MEYADKVLRCVNCGKDFVFTAGEQVFFHTKEFKNDPKRCKVCKAKLGRMPPRAQTVAVCADCGQQTTVPFKPSKGEPVFCRSCFDRRKQSNGGAV